MREFLLRLYWAGRILMSKNYVLITDTHSTVRITAKRPFLLEDKLTLQEEHAMLKYYKQEFSGVLKTFESEMKEHKQLIHEITKEVKRAKSTPKRRTVKSTGKS